MDALSATAFSATAIVLGGRVLDERCSLAGRARSRRSTRSLPKPDGVAGRDTEPIEDADDDSGVAELSSICRARLEVGARGLHGFSAIAAWPPRVLDEHVLDEHVLDERVLDKRVLDERVLDERVLGSSSSVEQLSRAAQSSRASICQRNAHAKRMSDVRTVTSGIRTHDLDE